MFRSAVLLAAIITAANTTADPVDVYIFSGQSNMVGASKLAELTEELRQPIPEARFWNGSAFEVLTPGQTKLSSQVTRFGPELAFAREYAKSQPSQPVYIIKYAVGGRPLHAGFDGGKWTGEAPGPGRSTFYPGHSLDDPNIGVLYRNLVETAKAALAQLKQDGMAYRVRGVLWMQGEADAKNPISAVTYATNLRHWHARLLSDLGIEPCPLVFGQALPYTPHAERFTNPTELRQSQANLDRDSGHADAYAWARMVPTEGMDLYDDTVHYNADGQLKLGAAFARAMDAMLTSNR